ncbi:MAG: hypothetical protein WBP81_35815 [Solirubrobacteraceae bacterium]
MSFTQGLRQLPPGDMVQRTHENRDIHRDIIEWQSLRPSDEIARAAASITIHRRRELLLRDLNADHLSAAAGELANECTSPAADIHHDLARRLGQPLEDRQISAHYAAQGRPIVIGRRRMALLRLSQESGDLRDPAALERPHDEGVASEVLLLPWRPRVIEISKATEGPPGKGTICKSTVNAGFKTKRRSS